MAEPARNEEEVDDDRPPPLRDSQPIATIGAGESFTALAHESRRYHSEEQAKRPPMRMRSLRAYWTTWKVIWS